MTKPSNIYLLAEYSNPINFKQETYQTTHVSQVTFTSDNLKICLSEENSLVEDKYSLNLKSSKYVVEGNIVKESGLHKHAGAHAWRHLQFVLQASKEKIRIKLDGLDEEDYRNCIKGFLFISQKVLEHEQKESKIGQDLISYFYNDSIKHLQSEGRFLLSKIEQAASTKGILDNSNKPLDLKQIEKLKDERHLLPFLEW